MKIDGEEVDFSGHEPLGTCPKCCARVFDHGMSYLCEKSVGAAKSCDFRSGKVILQQEVGRDEMKRLLETGKTSLLKGFVSARTRRKFSAYLVRDPATGKVGFEFEARAPKAGAKEPAKAKAEAEPTAATKAPAKTAKKPAAKKGRNSRRIPKRCICFPGLIITNVITPRRSPCISPCSPRSAIRSARPAHDALAALKIGQGTRST
jgi:DNA topoisomerase-3